MSGNCNGTQCIVSCSCKAGWTTLSTSYSTRAAASGAYVAVTAPRKYADGTPTCYKNVTCADYGYVSSLSAGYYGKQVKVTTSGATLTCYATIGTCTYSCPSNYYYSGNIYGCYKAGSSAYETLNQSSYVNNCSATSSTKCYQKIYKSLADEGITSKTCTGCNVSVSNKSTCGNTYYTCRNKTLAEEGITSKTCTGCNVSVSNKSSCGNTYYTCRNKTLAEEGITSVSSCASGQIKQQKTSPCGNTYYTCNTCYFTESSTTSCPTGYSTATTSCSGLNVLKKTNGTKTTTYSSSTAGCSKAATTSVATNACGKCERKELTDPCKGTCDLNSDIPYYKVLQGNRCCCPTQNATNSIYCNCCRDTVVDPIEPINPCAAYPSSPYHRTCTYDNYERGYCCDRTGNNNFDQWCNNVKLNSIWQVPTGCFATGTAIY